MERQLSFDVVLVGAGPANLICALHLTNLLKKHNIPYENKIAIIEKGLNFGAHSISGAILDPVALNECLPDHLDAGFPIEGKIKKEEIHFLTKHFGVKLPFIPPFLENRGNYIVSLSKVTSWFAAQLEKNDVLLFKEVSGTELLTKEGKVVGIKTGERMKGRYPGYELLAKATLLGEGSAGFLTKKAIEEFQLNKNSDHPLYELGVKEVYEVKEGAFGVRRVAHFMGYPLQGKKSGGAFIYGMEKNKVAIGIITHLGSSDPLLDPHAELQRFKSHPQVKRILEGGKVISYGAKTLPCGGYYTIPKLTHPGLMILGDGAGLVDSRKLKGIHTAMKSGILAAEVLFEAFKNNDYSQLEDYEKRLRSSWVFKDLYKARNFTPAVEMGIPFPGGPLIAYQLLTGGAVPGGKLQLITDYKKTKPLSEAYRWFKPLPPLQADEKIVIEKLTDLYLSRTTHDENQESHITLKDPHKCQGCDKIFGEPCTHFCPAKVYENLDGELIINFSNCLHCKTCDLKCPRDNIEWRLPEAGGGPQYSCL